MMSLDRWNQPRRNITDDNSKLKVMFLIFKIWGFILELGEGEGKDDGHAMAPQNQSCHGVKSTMIGRHADQMTLYSCVIGCSRFTAMENENTRAERVSDAVSGAKRDNSQSKKKKQGGSHLCPINMLPAIKADHHLWPWLRPYHFHLSCKMPNSNWSPQNWRRGRLPWMEEHRVGD